jgi:hypothetical protein
MIAYLDANSGSMIASVFVAGAAGIAVVFKMGWSRILAVFSPKHRRALKEARAQSAAEAAVAEPDVTSDVN